MRITEAEHGQRKSRMIRAAYELFCEYGIDCVSMADIAKAAGVSTNSVFRYFDNKAALVQETQLILWDEITTCFLLESKKKISCAQNGFEELEILLYNFKSLYENHSKYVLFACDYRLFLIRNNIRLPQSSHDKRMEHIRHRFILALERGHADRSVSIWHSAQVQFQVLWGVMRGFVGEIVLCDYAYTGRDSEKRQFDLALQCVLDSLRGEG